MKQATEMHKVEKNTADYITRQTLLGDIVEQFPEAVETLLDLGVHCVGCHVSPYELLEDGFRAHGMSDAEITQAVKKLNTVVSQVRSKPEESGISLGSITLSDLAIEKIKTICQAKQRKALRLQVQVGGCSGNMYAFELVDLPKEDDVIIERHGAKVFVDQKSLQKIDGSEIDYIDDLTGAGFTLRNPQAAHVCGCGKSFR